MITAVTIENFKGFKKLQLPELSRITLLGGSNNVGKSSVLEALLLFHIKVQPEFLFNHLAMRGVSAASFEADTVLAPAFRDYRLDHNIIIACSEDGHQEKMVIAFNPSYAPHVIEVPIAEPEEISSSARTSQKPLPAYSVDISYQSRDKLEQCHLVVRANNLEVRRDENYALTKQQPVIFSGAKSLTNPNELATRFGQLDVVGKQDIVIEFLRILEPRLKSLSSITMGAFSFVHGDIGIGRKIPIAFMGEGIDRLLSTVLTIATTKDGLLLIDEFENGLHYSVMAKVWESISKAARDFNCQIVTTTHSYECLQAAYEGIAKAGLEDEFRYIRLDRTPNDIVAKTYSHAVLGAALERGWEVR